jgi:hypothetical protein
MQIADEQVALLKQEKVAHLERIEVLRDRREKRVATAALPKEKGVSWSSDGPEERILFTRRRRLASRSLSGAGVGFVGCRRRHLTTPENPGTLRTP